MIVILSIIVVVVLIAYFFMRQPQFGAAPGGERLARVKHSPHFRKGEFHNLVDKPVLSEGHTLPGEIWKLIVKKYPGRKPVDVIPSSKTNLFQIPTDSNSMVWFGHSSVYIHLNGKKILIDPTFSGKASPLKWGTRAFKGTDVYSVEDIPEIDYLLITHDHYDHLDYETIVALKNKVKTVICGLGVGAHFERWGYQPEQLIEKDWYEKLQLDDQLTLHIEPTHHGSGRDFTHRNKTLWVAFLIETPGMKIYISGDGGFDERFKLNYEKFGAVDWAIVENGQYDAAWHSVHNLPEEVLQAALDLHTRNLLTVHNSKFTLSKHHWTEPLAKIKAASIGEPYHLVTPMIGELVNLEDSKQHFSEWWKGLR